uniref:PLD phosphodiesterase domain-containing protein n=1 Tax=Strigamia maritima TaxID=126957 RepID=T1J970_STRMM
EQDESTNETNRPSENDISKSDVDLLPAKETGEDKWSHCSGRGLAISRAKKEARDEVEIKSFLMRWDRCPDNCRLVILESIPEDLVYNNSTVENLPVFVSWLDLIRNAKKSIDIASSYWTLRGSDVWHDPSDWQGEQIFSELLKAGTERNIKIRIAQNQPAPSQPNLDTEELQAKKAAEVRSLDFQKLMGAGILHTKMWLVDNLHIYLGSANLDWRSLTQVKELGVTIHNCSCLAEDMSKIFQIYWDLGKPGAEIPPHWPPEYSTRYNNTSPLHIKFNDSNAYTYLASSPPPFCAQGRTSDIDAILDVINSADKYIYVAVMDYFPATIYTTRPIFWPVIDDALKKAAIERQVEVKLLASHWNHTDPAMMYYLKSLAVLNNSYSTINIEVKMFVVPSFTKEEMLIPFARVNHNKYMVTDSVAYIGTSNWSGDYFINTGGIGFVINETVPDFPNSTQFIREDIQKIFLRDWNSEYAQPIENYLKKHH